VGKKGAAKKGKKDGTDGASKKGATKKGKKGKKGTDTDTDTDEADETRRLREFFN